MFRSRFLCSLALSLTILPPEEVLGGVIPWSLREKNKAQLEQSPLEEGRYYEGDILTDVFKGTQNKPDGGPNVKSVVADRNFLWPNKTLYYQMSDEFTESDKRWIRNALNDLQKSTCVRFIESTGSGVYMLVRNVLGCASPVGYYGITTDMYLTSPGCHSWGTIQHEFLHTLGFWHEHTRPDRDQYVEIIWNKIRPGREENFLARKPGESESEGLPYDYYSVMHYRGTAFSKDGYQTIVPRQKDAVIGQRIRFSRLDLAKLNRLYRCGSEYYTGDDYAPRQTTDEEGEKEEREKEEGMEEEGKREGEGKEEEKVKEEKGKDEEGKEEEEEKENEGKGEKGEEGDEEKVKGKEDEKVKGEEREVKGKEKVKGEEEGMNEKEKNEERKNEEVKKEEEGKKKRQQERENEGEKIKNGREGVRRESAERAVVLGKNGRKLKGESVTEVAE